MTSSLAFFDSSNLPDITLKNYLNVTFNSPLLVPPNFPLFPLLMQSNPMALGVLDRASWPSSPNSIVSASSYGFLEQIKILLQFP